MKDKKIILFPFIRCYSPEKLAAFLDSMVRKGWFPKKITLFSYFFISFIKTEKKEYRFAVDFNLMSSRGYRDFYSSFNWIHLGKMSNLNLWYKEPEDDSGKEIYTEKKHILQNQKRYALFYLAAIIPLIMLFAAITAMLVLSFSQITVLKAVIYCIIDILLLCTLLATSRQFSKLLKLINKEKKEL